MFRVLSVAALAIAFFAGTPQAMAHKNKCGIFAFEVNDYGKEGPKKDAKRLLDKHIETWAEKNKISSFRRSGKKKVSCYLFLDFGFFDEWTCKAEQTVCYHPAPSSS